MNKTEIKTIKDVMINILEVRFELIYPTKFKRITYENYLKDYENTDEEPYFDKEDDYIDYEYDMYSNHLKELNDAKEVFINNVNDNFDVLDKDTKEILFNDGRFTSEEEKNIFMNNVKDTYTELDKDTKEILLNYDSQLVKLNSILSDDEKIKIVVSLEEEMKKIQVKKYITTKEFSDIYNISISSQKDLRARLHNSLPYHQKVKRGKVVYVVEEIEKWLKNQYK